MDIAVEDGKITALADPAENSRNALEKSGLKPDRIVDATGKIIAPGLIDMHVHFREPGQEYKETILTGCQAAAAGGFTAVCTMPNTYPVNDNRQVTEYIRDQAAKAMSVKVFPVGAISIGLMGKQLSEYGDLKSAGVIAVSDDGFPVSNSFLMRCALEYAGGFNLLVISHCEDPALSADGVMNEGPVATQMGLPGIPNAVESIMVMRDIALCQLTGVPLHIAHVSTRESVNAIREAKKSRIPVTAETAPHYVTLTDESVRGYNTHAKMNPPLRSRADRDAVREGLSDGTIDVIASDHAPHSTLEKDVEFDKAANGIVGLETSLSLGLKLVEDGVLTMAGLIEKMSKNPARILGLNNHLSVGCPADLTIIDPNVAHKIDPGAFLSKGRNTPFEGWEIKGKAVLTMVEGRIVFEDGNISG